MDVQEIAFSLDNNAQFYTGESIDMNINTDASGVTPVGWNTMGNQNREVKGMLLGQYQPLFRSQKIGGKVVLWAQFNQVPEGKSNWAVMKSGTNFEHIWSSWRGQRWVEEVEEVVVNVDEGQLSFQDLWEFHQEEVFRDIETYPVDSTPSWIDENTMDISDMQIAFGTQQGFSMNIVADDGTSIIVRSGGDRVSWGNANTLTMEWVQFTDDEGEVVVHSGEGEIVSESALVYDERNVRTVGEVVELWEFDFTLPTVSEGAENKLNLANYSEGLHQVEMIYSDDNIETLGVNEERWVVYFDSNTVGQYNNQEDASEAFEQQKQQVIDNWELVNQKQVEADAQAEKDKEVRQKFGLGEFKKMELPEGVGSMILGLGMISIALILIFRLTRKTSGEGSSE